MWQLKYSSHNIAKMPCLYTDIRLFTVERKKDRFSNVDKTKMTQKESLRQGGNPGLIKRFTSRILDLQAEYTQPIEQRNSKTLSNLPWK